MVRLMVTLFCQIVIQKFNFFLAWAFVTIRHMK